MENKYWVDRRGPTLQCPGELGQHSEWLVYLEAFMPTAQFDLKYD